GSGEICLNGPAARKAQVGDIIIIISYCSMEKEEARKHNPILIFPNEDNRLA
ncbi:MAG: aspartate 1-decarboxylase, partial [Marinoscillum sp.]